MPQALAYPAATAVQLAEPTWVGEAVLTGNPMPVRPLAPMPQHHRL